MGRTSIATSMLRDVSRKSTTARIWLVVEGPRAAVPWARRGTAALDLELGSAGACLAAEGDATNVEAVAAATIAIIATSFADRILGLARVGKSGADGDGRLLVADGYSNVTSSLA